MTVRTARTPAAVGVELLASYAAAALFVALVTRGDGAGPSLVAVAAAACGSFALARALQQTDLDDAQFRGVGLAASVVALAAIALFEYQGDLAGRASVAGSLALAAVWLRGVVRGRAEVDYDDVLASVSAGLAAVSIAAVAAPNAAWPESFGAVAIVYTVAALTALALYQAPHADEPLPAFASHWALPAAALTGTAFLAAMLAGAVDPESLGILEPIGRPLAFAGEFFVTFVIGPVAAAIAFVLSHLAGALSDLLPNRQDDQLRPQEPEPPLRKDDGTQPLWLRIVGWTIGGAAGMVLLAGGLWLLWSLFRRFARPRRAEDRDRRESVEAASSLASDLGALMSAIGGRLRRHPASSRPSVAIRRLYADMLETAADRGLERPPAATPMQFAPLLDQRFASDAPSAISEAFCASRYGGRDAGADTVRMLRERWRAASAQG